MVNKSKKNLKKYKALKKKRKFKKPDLTALEIKYMTEPKVIINNHEVTGHIIEFK